MICVNLIYQFILLFISLVVEMMRHYWFIIPWLHKYKTIFHNNANDANWRCMYRWKLNSFSDWWIWNLLFLQPMIPWSWNWFSSLFCWWYHILTTICCGSHWWLRLSRTWVYSYRLSYWWWLRWSNYWFIIWWRYSNYTICIWIIPNYIFLLFLKLIFLLILPCWLRINKSITPCSFIW